MTTNFRINFDAAMSKESVMLKKICQKTKEQVLTLCHQEIMVIAGMFLAVMSILFFIKVADEVVEQDTQKFDNRILTFLRHRDNPATPIGPAWLGKMSHEITSLGSWPVVLLITAIVAGATFLAGRRRAGLWMLVTVFSGTLVMAALKMLFSRPRPDIVPHLEIVTTTSFPSGHSMLSAIVYLTLGAMLAQILTGHRLKIYSLLIASGLTFIVGISRVFLGVHYPTDVLAGWAAGLAWALLCWLAAFYRQKKYPGNNMNKITQ
jgi:undecaprenyl-diphosphatase